MKKLRFNKERIVFSPKQAELSISMPDVRRKLDIADAILYTYRNKYGVISPSELEHLQQLEEENLQLKRLVADLSLNNAMLRDVLAQRADAGTTARRVQNLQAPDKIPAKHKSSLRYGSAALRSDIVRLLTVHCACLSVRSPKRESTMDTAGTRDSPV